MVLAVEQFYAVALITKLSSCTSTSATVDWDARACCTHHNKAINHFKYFLFLNKVDTEAKHF